MQMTNNTKAVDFGIPEYYEYYLKNSKHFVDKKVFNKIISEFNKGITELIINDRLEYFTPKLNMTLCIRKIHKEVRVEDNKIINTAPIDWKATKKLWEENHIAKEKKILIRFLNTHTSKYVFRIKFLKNGKEFKNRSRYKFKAIRSFSRNLAKRIFDKTKPAFDAYNLY